MATRPYLTTHGLPHAPHIRCPSTLLAASQHAVRKVQSARGPKKKGAYLSWRGGELLAYHDRCLAFRGGGSAGAVRTAAWPCGEVVSLAPEIETSRVSGGGGGWRRKAGGRTGGDAKEGEGGRHTWPTGRSEPRHHTWCEQHGRATCIHHITPPNGGVFNTAGSADAPNKRGWIMLRRDQGYVHLWVSDKSQ